MKKFFKAGLFTAVLSAMLAVCIAFSGCVSEKKFEKAGMSITLTSAFHEKELAAYTSYYESADALVLTLKEEFSLLSGMENKSVSQYTDMVLENNKFSAEKLTREGKAYMYFTYEKTVNGKDFYYLATTHKSSDAFWLIQFACVKEDKEKLTEDFLGWADTVVFTTNAAQNAA